MWLVAVGEQTEDLGKTRHEWDYVHAYIGHTLRFESSFKLFIQGWWISEVFQI